MTNTTKRITILPAGRVEVQPHAIARIAAHAAMACDGVLGLVPASAGADARPLTAAQAHRGVRVTIQGDAVTTELFVVIRYGAAIGAVAEQLSEHVRQALVTALGDAPVTVQLRVQGLRSA